MKSATQGTIIRVNAAGYKNQIPAFLLNSNKTGMICDFYRTKMALNRLKIIG